MRTATFLSAALFLAGCAAPAATMLPTTSTDRPSATPLPGRLVAASATAALVADGMTALARTSEARPQTPTSTRTATHVRPTGTSQPTPIVLPTLGPFPTLPPPQPRTPAAPAACPSPTGSQPTPTRPDIPQGFYPSEAFGPFILDYLNSKGSSVGLASLLSQQRVEQDGVEWEPDADLFLADINYDNVDDVVVSLLLSAEGYDFTDGWLWVFACDAGTYVRLHDQYIGSYSGMFADPASNDGIRSVRDMNRDGSADLLLSHVEDCGNHANCTRVFEIHGWNGTRLVDLAFSAGFYSGEPFPGIYVFNGDGIVRDTNADGYPDLVTSNGITHYYPDIGPERARTDIWGWNGQIYTLVRWEHTPPVYRIQAVWDGDDASRFGDYERAASFYQQAIFDEKLVGWSPGQLWRPKNETWFWDSYTPPPPDPDERARLSAYARYRLMLADILQGNASTAVVVYRTLQEKFPAGSVGAAYAQLATAFWGKYASESDVVAGCVDARSFAEAHSNETLSPLGGQVYSTRRYTSEDICPFK